MVKKPSSDLIVNRKARFSYEILEKFEAGVELLGTEVKSCREKSISIAESFAKFKGNEIFVSNLNIAPYSHGNMNNHDPIRERRLLLHKKEIIKLRIATEAKGLTVVPLKMYLTRGKIKMQIGLCRGKNVADKRNTLKNRQADIDAKRSMKNF
ncbi:MAG: SsrA-binding protein SmpB [Lentisphaeria bacterium]|nr:SsrA-binding protein SmpB [Lentisphaeria bacterium]